MRRGFAALILVIFLLFPAISPLLKGSPDLSQNCYGWLEEKNGVKVLHLYGSYYDMGYMHGSLLRDQCLENLRAFIEFAERKYSYKDFLRLWEIVKNYVPEPYKEEMRGLADGANIPFEKVAIGNIITMLVHCSGFAAWGPATVDGKLYQARSMDFPSIRDPITGKYVQENTVLIVRKPIDGFASLDPSFAGSVGSLGGFNEKGIAVEVLSSWSNDECWNGIPMIFRIRMVLDHASTINDALDLLTSNRTCGWNFIVSDGKIPAGYAVETTANHYYVGTWNGSAEATPPFWIINHVVRRTNIFISPETAATQRKYYNPRIVFSFWGKNTLGWSGTLAFFPWRHYKALSKEIEGEWGNIDLNRSINIIRSLYQGKTDLIFLLMMVLKFYTPLYQWAACPATGDMLVSFATPCKPAHRSPIYHFNLFELLSEEH